MKWVTSWSNAISISENLPQGYAKNITLRYPILAAFTGNKVRITLDNYTGTETAHFGRVTIAKAINDQDYEEGTVKTVTFNGNESVDIKAGEKAVSDEIEFNAVKNEKFIVSIYFDEFTSLRGGVVTSGPLSKGYFSDGDMTNVAVLDRANMKEVLCVYYLSDIEICTEDECSSILCFGDSITAQAWPEYLQLNFLENNKPYSTCRKAVSGARVLRDYSALPYQHYGIAGVTRFDHDSDLSSAKAVVILEGVNDFIHPVGVEVNPFRPWSDLPTPEELVDGYRVFISKAKEKGLKVFIGTILPINGWRTYEPFRNDLRVKVNEWIKTTDEIDGYIDFADIMHMENDDTKMNPAYDSGDHLHPNLEGYKVMAKAVYKVLEEKDII